MPDLKAIFLEQINDECFSCGVQTRQIREKAFLKLRFHPENRDKQHREIATQMEKLQGLNGDCTTGIGTTCQNVVRAITRQYEPEMMDDGVDVDKILNRTEDSGNGKGKKGHWETVYTWLYDSKFLRWLAQEKNRIWKAWKAEAKPDLAKISFIEIPKTSPSSLKDPKPSQPGPEQRKLKGSQPREKEQIHFKRDYSMEIELKESDCYLLLFSRSESFQGEETRYLFCPSKAFAPHLKPVSTKVLLPQLDSEFGAIEFDEPGIEEYLGILLKEKPSNLDRIIAFEEESFPVWDDLSMYKLLQELEKQSDCQIFYQSFEVVST
jgi:hypothetical protein